MGKEDKLFAYDVILYLKPKKIHQKCYQNTSRHHKHLQQSRRRQTQFIKISSLSIHQQ
jgi:hypothetical protein